MADARKVLARAYAKSMGHPDPDRPADANGPIWQKCLHIIDAQVTALTAAGLAIVPTEPTPEMISACAGIEVTCHACDVDVDVECGAHEIWEAMLAAAPKP